MAAFASGGNGNEKSLEMQVKALNDLIEVTKAVVSTLDLDTVLQAILKSAMGFAETPAGSILLLSEDQRELVPHAHSGLSIDFVKNRVCAATAAGFDERLLEGGEISFIEDTGKVPGYHNPVAAKEGIRSQVSVPLLFQGRLQGILSLDDFVPRSFDREKMGLLSVLASFAAMSIHEAMVQKQTKLLAITDSLTGLHNDKHFQQHFKREMARAQRYHKPLSIVMMDIDDFRLYNDQFGHASGNMLLGALGARILQTIRGVDIAFRYGGEEFIVLLPDTRLDQALLAAERLRKSVQEWTAREPVGSATHGVTVSIGVANYPENADDLEELFNMADTSLSQAKCSGKNKVCHQESLVSHSS